MDLVLQPYQLMVILLASWVHQQQQEVIEYLRTENSVLKEKFGKKRILLTDKRVVDWQSKAISSVASNSSRLGLCLHRNFPCTTQLERVSGFRGLIFAANQCCDTVRVSLAQLQDSSSQKAG